MTAASQNKSNRASTGAKAEDILPDPLPPQLRLSSGANRRGNHDASVCFSASANFRAPSLSPDTGTKKLSVSVQPGQAASFAALSDSKVHNAQLNCSLTKGSDKLLGSQHADKENLLMGVHVPRFNMIEVRLLQLLLVISHCNTAVCCVEGHGVGLGWKAHQGSLQVQGADCH